MMEHYVMLASSDRFGTWYLEPYTNMQELTYPKAKSVSNLFRVEI